MSPGPTTPAETGSTPLGGLGSDEPVGPPAPTRSWSRSRLGRLVAGPAGRARAVAVALVGAAVVFGLVELWAEHVPVAYLNDSALHAQMARYALGQMRAGHVPLEGWYPFLNLGSPLFLHYQNLGETLVGLVGWAVGPNTAYAWSVYLLLALWPIPVYWSARVLGWDRFAASGAAVVAPFLVSVPSIGYEQGAYVFLGYGVFAQLCAMWLLPLAWAYSFRAVSTGRHRLAAVLLVAATSVFHFFTGYLAFVAVVLWPFLRPSELGVRLRRAVGVLAAALGAIAWVVVPLLVERPWTSVNQLLLHTASANSYGAGRILGWLVTGRLLDAGRWPVVTVLTAVGLWRCLVRWRSSERARALVVAWAVLLLLYFGRPTLGPLVDAIPGHEDLFLRRFEMGFQLACLFLAGVGGASIVGLVGRARRRLAAGLTGAGHRVLASRTVRAVGGIGLVVVALSPAWTQLASYDAADAAAVRAQHVADATAGAEVNTLVAAAEQLGGGRIYAGMPTNWGARFLVGDVQVYKYLAADNADEVGFTLRTASLASDPEAYFEDTNPADYAIFGVRYLILPAGMHPPVPARELLVEGPYVLYEVRRWGYFQVADAIAPVTANRSDLGTAMAPFVRSGLAAEGRYPTVAFGGLPAGPSTPAAGTTSAPPGRVISSRADLLAGRATATVRAAHAAVVVLKVSYNPRWTATVDGQPVATEMLAPALVGVPVPAGTHVIAFRYRPISYYPELLAVGLVSLVLAAAWERIASGLRRRRRPRPT